MSRGYALQCQSSLPRGAKFDESEGKSKPDVAEEFRKVRTSIPIPVLLGDLSDTQMLVGDNAAVDRKPGQLTLTYPRSY